VIAGISLKESPLFGAGFLYLATISNLSRSLSRVVILSEARTRRACPELAEGICCFFPLGNRLK